MNKFEYYTIQEAELFSYYSIPKELFTNSHYRNISTDAKLLYGLLRDRNQLSIKNNWMDAEGHIFIIFTREEVEKLLDIGNQKSNKLFKELRDVELIKEVKQGLNKPNIIYVGKIIPESIENQLKCENHMSGNVKITLQELGKSHPSNTNINNTEKENKSVSQSQPEQIEKKKDGQMEETTIELNDIKKQVDYNSLIQAYDVASVDEIVLNVLDMYYSKFIYIKGDKKPQSIVHSVLNKLTYAHIEYTLERYNAVKINGDNKKDYLRTMIYNSVLELNVNYRSQFNLSVGEEES